jgi:polysaccharide deacetylase family protein (PEP-CTERM system associated)
VHVFSVDVEDYFHVNAFEPFVSRDRWDEYPSRVDRSTGVILDLLSGHGTTGTFFTLGWLARTRPALVRRIAEAGHEIASHGFWHRRIPTLTPDQFRDDVRDAKSALEDVCSQRVVGFRAPSFSIIPGYEWAFDVLLEEGYEYDSSRFPIRRPGYGSPNTPRTPYLIRRPSGALLELPLATARLLGILLPAAGGGYLRQFPFPLVRRAFRQATAFGMPAVFYVHSWEVDREQPPMPVPPHVRLRHYRGLDRTLALMHRLLSEFAFTSIATLRPTLSLAEVTA